MRSSKNRSRSKPNNRNSNNRSATSVINRTYDSSGPEGKVRGTPQQIIEKYNQLARDAQLSNDRVAAENFQQHAEHYTRLLGEAQKEIDAQREQQEREQQERRERQEAERLERAERAERNGERSERTGDRSERSDRPERSERPERRPRRNPVDQAPVSAVPGEGEQPDISAPKPAAATPAPAPSDAGEASVSADVGLVETPEEAPKPKRARAPRKPRAPRAPKTDASAEPKTEAAASPAPSGDVPESAG
jgi:hypothetical protein